MKRRVIGLYGGSGAGKSTAAAILAGEGARIIDADLVSREVSAPGGSAHEDIRAAFPEYFDERGELDRRALGRHVFSDPQAKKLLEDIVQPKMRERILEMISEAPEDTIIFDCALLTEPAFSGIADENWLVSAPRERRLARIGQRDGLDPSSAAARLDSQKSDEAYTAAADRIIENDGTTEELAAKLKDALKQD